MSVEGKHFKAVMEATSHPESLRSLKDFLEGLGSVAEWQVWMLRNLANAIERDEQEHIDGMMDALESSHHHNDMTDIPSAACKKCGGWTSFGGVSQYSNATAPVHGRTGCSC